jgi:hypothetical protein
MTIYPLVIRIGSFELTGYGIMMMVAFLAGGWLVSLELRRRGLREDYSGEMIVAAVVGGIVGAKLWYVALFRDPAALFSRGGLVWYGGFIGGALAVILNGRRLKVPLRWTMQLGAPALAAAYAIGRVGCFLVNDDYGRPTTLPWHRPADRPRRPSDPALRDRADAGGLRRPLAAPRPRPAYRLALRPVPRVRGRGAIPGGDRAGQGRPTARAVHARAAHQRPARRDRRGAARTLEGGTRAPAGTLPRSGREGHDAVKKFGGRVRACW